MLIDRLLEIDNIYSLENEFFIQKNIKPTRLSTWDCSREFLDLINKNIVIPSDIDFITYKYSYNIEKSIHNCILKKLGGNSNCRLIFMQNNTISIVNIVNFLKLNKKKNIAIVNPAYFSIRECLNSFGLKPYEISANYENNHFSLPNTEELLKYDVIWITSPFFSIGQYFDKKDILKIKTLINNGVLVIGDESYASHGSELIRNFSGHKNFISIYSPHKSICINGIKFSVVITHKDFLDFFETWEDVFAGNLLSSNVYAIYHYLSKNFELCELTVKQYLSTMRLHIVNILEKYPCIAYDKNTNGNLLSLFFPHISSSYMKSKSFLRQMIFQTATSVIPGYLNGIDGSSGFNFRINLCLANKDYFYSLNRLLFYLCQKKY
ncbi:hypothetical protein HMPREF1022_02964 [Desulfovibrio sp. 6_1_46AFAA]|uniref:aminotransferase class I/II-fold pyridoxal phosphate-dependent enzyme n=1 Tax=Desulfovibrio sp. 6_1_46AFAA TaxID=665942 RepID=UPI0002236EA1|nr:aminotransferase class I/II-fold pyridoxal phosphate-dependent enzyme [Desulfovibrio sp. 6_1_46AFAA]EGW50021.1 hypothetical protein HMPREF1022_02964 [Desulfovibrio sp. 6_1_46AFAA]